MRFWGITGTNGKTTTTWIFSEFLNASPGRKCGYITTVEVFDGVRRFYTGYTTPPLQQLKAIYAAMEANGCTDCVMEVSSHAIHQHRTGDTVFSGGAFTNLSEDHLDYHKTMEAYFDVKLDFARQIAASHPTRPDMGRNELPPFVVCLDGGYGPEMFRAVGNLAVNVKAASYGATGTAGRARAMSAPLPAYDLSHLPLVGAYNKSNVLTAAALAEAAGVSRETIQAVIPKLAPRWGRLERVENPQVKAKVFVDFAHTPDGLEKVLAAVREEMEKAAGPETGDAGDGEGRKAGDLWIVFGAGGDRDPMKRPLMGAACARLADRLVVTSDNPRSEEPMAIIGAILEGVRSTRVGGEVAPRVAPASQLASLGGYAETNVGGVIVEPDRAKAIAYALAHAQEGDFVVIAGKGHETTQEIKGVKYPFNDREQVRNFQSHICLGGDPAADEGNNTCLGGDLAADRR